jgi:uncharacterized membrane protein YdjX (TVP38/TMEM64 family)
VRLSFFIAAATVGVGASAVWGVPDIEGLRKLNSVAGMWTPWVTVFIFAVLALGPVPKSLLAATIGTIFGLKVGLPIVYGGTLVSAVAAFGLGRLLVRGAVQRLRGRRLRTLNSLLRNHGLLAVIVGRLSPIVPFSLFNYAAGAAALSGRDFIAGTAIGVVPGSVAYVALGSQGHSVGSWSPLTIVAAISTVATVTLVCRSIKRYLDDRLPSTQAESPTLPLSARQR